MTRDDAKEVPIQSLSRAMKVLGQFTSGRSEMDLNEITRRTGMSRATAHRYCLSLRGLDLLRYDPRTGMYGLGSRTIELGTLALESHHLAQVADRCLSDLMADQERTLAVSVWDGRAPLIVRAHDNTTSAVQITVRVGRRLDPFNSAQGPVYLAFSDRIRSQFEGTAALAAIEPKLEEIRRTGVSIRRTGRGVTVAAVPVGEEVAGGLALLSSDPEVDPASIDDLKVAARQLAAELDARS